MHDVSVIAAHAAWIGALSATLAAISYRHWRGKDTTRPTPPTPPTRAATGQFVQWVARLEIPALVLIAPALLFPTPARLLVLVAVPFLWMAARRTSGSAIPRTPLNVALFVLLAMVGVSLYATFDIIWSLGKVSGVVLGVLFFWAITRWLITPHRLAVATALFLLAGGALAVLALVGTTRFYKFEGLPMQFPVVIRGVPGAEQGFNPNAVAGCLVLFVPLQIALLATARGRTWAAGITGRWIMPFQVLLLALTGGTLLLMQSRAAWLGLIVAATIAGAWRSRIIRALALCGAVVIVLAATQVDTRAIVSRALDRSGSSLDYAVAVRLELWSKALEGIREHPVTGMGMNAFRKLKPVRFPIKYPAYIAVPEEPLPHAHNHLLQAALDLGIPGLIAYAAVWIVAATLLVQVLRSSQEVHRIMAGGLAAGLMAHFVFSMTDAIPLGAKVGILFWFTLALTVGVHRVSLPAPRDPSR
jgi:O-antigen ligase